MGKILNKIKEKKEKVLMDVDDLDKVFDKATMKAYEHYYKRWRGLCGVQLNQRIDFKLPCIEVESKLCDPRNLKMIRNGTHTDDFLKLLSSD